ncbi:hypothetical protein NADFUDRAFT_52377 [Nadsonia fulvescens var. elongata DSM 6958]|uniref:Sensitive to high expression protein 9, mitochondrial n=1 Tax=Nadsonia fulvescens var. elongata DSM 6958 TaxID=857566 RepID=A0A1E3PH52_9ASCO|nr:hypothetical protein NADFUDRAFT_52377 [Nadsonia fulvescens var. elongata DSM 6958]
MLRIIQKSVRFRSHLPQRAVLYSKCLKTDLTKPGQESKGQLNRGSPTESNLKNGIIPDSIKYVETQNRNLTHWVGKKLQKIQSQVFTASKTLNDITGYTSIEKLKQSIEDQGLKIKMLKNEVRQANQIYTHAIEERSTSQRQLGDLLQRKNEWSNSDLEKFTNLYRNEHKREQEEKMAKLKLEEVEKELDNAQLELSRSILARYKEEQIWSDKIRRTSTGGTVAVMIFNILLFIIIQLGVEPWRRERLVNSFGDKVKEALKKQRDRLTLNNTKTDKTEESASGSKTSDSKSIGSFNCGADIVLGKQETPKSSEQIHEAVIPELYVNEVSISETESVPGLSNIYCIIKNAGGRLNFDNYILTICTALKRMSDYTIYIKAYTRGVELMSISNSFVSKWALELMTASSLGTIGGIILTQIWFYLSRYDWFM